MVFIHGGGFDVGNGYLHSGIPLAAVGDVIVVLINYRLGAFGYLTTGKIVDLRNIISIHYCK